MRVTEEAGSPHRDKESGTARNKAAKGVRREKRVPRARLEAFCLRFTNVLKRTLLTACVSRACRHSRRWGSLRRELFRQTERKYSVCCFRAVKFRSCTVLVHYPQHVESNSAVERREQF
ncbi:hypothetical protein NDU88_008674 [Pleurodeles waltl]|uniref:Uncharacterized protein n=1 Tax=Pleurodeles waltl TaxID=8319 RepID=A0AAV7QVA1_PLEWA|nr:hypothetical protein NDU88_008674 [Pleurodeles waltl]